jgi:hypothetical protein
MKQQKNPHWWDAYYDFEWDHAKLAKKREWEQVRLDHSSDSSRKIISLLFPEPFEELESAFRFGFGARLEYGEEYSMWDDNLEICLAKAWRTLNPIRPQTWEQDRRAILHGWHQERNLMNTDSKCVQDPCVQGLHEERHHHQPRQKAC